MRLSPAQARVVEAMRHGWELIVTRATERGHYIRLQNGVLTKQVRSACFAALRRRGVIIEAARGYPVTVYKLVEG